MNACPYRSLKNNHCLPDTPAAPCCPCFSSCCTVAAAERAAPPLTASAVAGELLLLLLSRLMLWWLARQLVPPYTYPSTSCHCSCSVDMLLLLLSCSWWQQGVVLVKALLLLHLIHRSQPPVKAPAAAVCSCCYCHSCFFAALALKHTQRIAFPSPLTRSSWYLVV